MKRKSLLFLLLFALIAPWAANAQTRETLTFNFEDQTIPSAWTNDATYPWVVTNAAANAGSYSIKSGNSQQNSTTSTITATYTFVADGTISFAARCSCEQTSTSSDWDYGTFYIDNVQQGDKIINSTTFSNYSYEVGAGEHTFMWRYKKDSSVSSNDDCLYVDDVVIDLGVAGALSKPTNLTCQLTPGNGTIATLSWTENGTATAWEIMLNNDETNLIAANSNPFTLTGLTPETSYTACVRATDGTNQSSWSNSVTFIPTNDYRLTVNDGTATNNYVPYYGYYHDSQQRSEFIIPASSISSMNGYAITSMKFYAGYTYSTNASIQVYLKEVSEGTFSNTTFYTEDGATTVYTGTLTISSTDGMTITFNDGYEYNGGNLLVGFYQASGGSGYSSSTCPFYGVTANGASISYYSSNSAVQRNFLPKVTFEFEPISSCRKPTNLATGEVGKRSATIRWTENGVATAWQVEVTDLDGGQVTTWNANATSFEIVGLTPGTRYSVRVNPVCDVEKWSDAITFRTEVACPAPTALEVVPTPISATVTWTGDASNYILRYGTCAEPDPTQPATIIFHADDIWQDGSGYQMLLDADATAFGTIIPETGALSMNCSGNEDIYAEFEYKIPANADGECTTSNVVIDNTITLQIPAGTYDWCITNPTPGDRIWIASAQGNVGGRADDYVFEAGMIYEFNMYMLGSNDATDVTIMCSNVDWTYVNNATSPYTINGLDPETEYYVGVQAVCGGEDGESAWTNATFTTPSNCDAPTALNVTNLMPTTATLNWTGYQDGFEVWYRPVAEGAELLNEDFENGLTWTTIDADGDGFNWDLHVNTGTGNHATHSGDGVMTSASYDNDAGAALTPDNYLVSPQVALGGSITFWASAQDADYAAEHFGVAVSTTSNTDASAFTTIQEWTMTAKKSAGDCKSIYDNGNYLVKNRGNRASGEWYQYTVDLSAYAGQTGYVAIRHFNCSDMFYLNVDDITIYSPATEEQDWIMASTDATTLNIEDLLPETTYEWQVRGENRSCSEDGYTVWSEMGNFTTPGLCDNPTNLTFEADGTTVTLSWTGYQESYNVTYYTPATGNVLLETGVGFDGDEDWTEVTEDEETGFYYLSDDYSYVGYGFSSTSTPQYLISPEFDALEGESFVEFMYYATGTEENADLPETFKIGYSTTDAEVASFTWGELYTVSGIDYMDVDLPAGTKYFAIQYESDHAADSTILFFLDFTVVSNYVAAGEPTTLEGVTSPVTIEGLDAETIYRWEVTGICGEESTTQTVYSYFMTGEAPSTITQTITLHEGWNWISLYVEVEDPIAMLQQLETALGDNATMISATEIYTEYLGDGLWIGDLDDEGVYNEQMYMIEAVADCEIELEGVLANAENYTIDINPGWNWIGFPHSEELLLEDALVNFPSEEEDQFAEAEAYSEYGFGMWIGDVETLVPGHGYMYFFNGEETTPLVYNTFAKARKAGLKAIEKKTDKVTFNRNSIKKMK